MTDEPFYSPHRTPPPPHQRRPGERLFEFVRSSDGAPMSCELSFRGESYGWEAQFFEQGELFGSRGGFPLRELAIRWAEQELSAFVTCPKCRTSQGWLCEGHPARPWPHDDDTATACAGTGDAVHEPRVSVVEW